MSSSEIIFKSPWPIRTGLKIDVYMDWPARLHDAIPLRFHAFGETVAAESGCAAVRIQRHEFRIAPKSDSAAKIPLTRSMKAS